MTSTQRSRIAFDAFNALVASVQTGFGPFIAVYLASQAWTQREIGAVLSVAGAVGIISQLPGGAAVDALRNKRPRRLRRMRRDRRQRPPARLVPAPPRGHRAEVLHGVGGCILGPAIAAVSLQMVGRRRLGERLGRNGRWSAIGGATAATVMGAIGTYYGETEVFYFAAALMLPALVAPRAGSAPRP